MLNIASCRERLGAGEANLSWPCQRLRMPVSCWALAVPCGYGFSRKTENRKKVAWCIDIERDTAGFFVRFFRNTRAKKQKLIKKAAFCSETPSCGGPSPTPAEKIRNNLARGTS